MPQLSFSICAGAVDADAKSAASFHCKHLGKAECKKIFKLYLEDFKTSLRPEQFGRSWTYYKSCVESKLNTLCGSKHVAYAIWEIGLPQLPSFATEQRDKQLSKTALEIVPEAIRNILNWLDLLACAITNHKATPEYQEALRKSGFRSTDGHGQSGLTPTELATRKEIRDAKLDLITARKLAKQWDDYTLTYYSCRPWQYKLLHVYWNGSLQQRFEELKQQSDADPKCRTPSVASLFQ